MRLRPQFAPFFAISLLAVIALLFDHQRAAPSSTPKIEPATVHAGHERLPRSRFRSIEYLLEHRASVGCEPITASSFLTIGEAEDLTPFYFPQI